MFENAISALQWRVVQHRKRADLERAEADGSNALANDCDRIADECVAAMRVLAAFAAHVGDEQGGAA
jgi:hypothetical protein